MQIFADPAGREAFQNIAYRRVNYDNYHKNKQKHHYKRHYPEKKQNADPTHENRPRIFEICFLSLYHLNSKKSTLASAGAAGKYFL